MKLFKHFTSGLQLFVLLMGLSLSGCKRDIPPLPIGELRQVTFKLAGFEAEMEPLDGFRATMPLARAVPGKPVQALLDVEHSADPQYLYFWSFNNEDLEPDIAVDGAGAGISFEASSYGFINGRKSDPFEAGRALTITGASSLVITLPVAAVTYLTDLSFDIKSSDTGPKDFSLWYSVDGGTTYEEWSASNQFEKTKNSQWNEYTFGAGDFPEFTESEVLKVKLVFLPGNRGDGSEYNESRGVVHLDNVRLYGVYNEDAGGVTTPSTLRYYIFSSEDGSVVQERELEMSTLGEGGALDVKLADGSYDVLFVAYHSDKGVVLPEELTNANEFYFAQRFDDYRAVTYAASLESVVVDEANVEEAVRLRRCYSLVEFDFTDSEADLRRVKRLEIARLHKDFLYTPFGSTAGEADLGADRIQFRDFNYVEENIVLHQFFGLIDVGGNISYELTAYGEGDVVLNTVTISENIRNNVWLRLRGKLLGESGAINGFSVALDTNWDELLDGQF